jgi:hypothetical protein
MADVPTGEKCISSHRACAKRSLETGAAIEQNITFLRRRADQWSNFLYAVIRSGAQPSS